MLPTIAREEAGLPAELVAPALERANVAGKFLFRGEQKLWVRGVTYCTFRPDEQGHAETSRATLKAYSKKVESPTGLAHLVADISAQLRDTDESGI